MPYKRRKSTRRPYRRRYRRPGLLGTIVKKIVKKVVSVDEEIFDKAWGTIFDPVNFTASDGIGLAHPTISAYGSNDTTASDVSHHTVHNEDTPGNTSLTGVGGIWSIYGIAQGTQNYQRLGNNIKQKGINIKATLALGGGATSNRYICQLIRDMNPSGAVPALADIFDPDATGAISTLSMVSSEARSRFQILKSRGGVLSSQGQNERSVQMFLSWYKGMGKTNLIQYNTANTVQPTGGYPVYFVVRSDGASGEIHLRLNARITYLP